MTEITLPTFGLTAGARFGLGFPRYRIIPAPAVGSPGKLSVPGEEVWRIMSIVASLTTSAVVANRAPEINVQDQDGNKVVRVPTTAFALATTTTQLEWLAGLGADYVGADGSQILPLPSFLVPGGFSINLSVGAMDVGDAISAIKVYAEVFPTGPEGYPIGMNRVNIPG